MVRTGSEFSGDGQCPLDLSQPYSAGPVISENHQKGIVDVL